MALETKFSLWTKSEKPCMPPKLCPMHRLELVLFTFQLIFYDVTETKRENSNVLIFVGIYASQRGSRKLWMEVKLWWDCTYVARWMHHQICIFGQN